MTASICPLGAISGREARFRLHEILPFGYSVGTHMHTLDLDRVIFVCR